MDEITRRAFMARFGIGLAAAGTFGVAESVRGSQAAERRGPVTPAEALAWHRLKDSRGGPTFTGSESWQHFTSFLEEKLREYGCVDFFSQSLEF